MNKEDINQSLNLGLGLQQKETALHFSQSPLLDLKRTVKKSLSSWQKDF